MNFATSILKRSWSSRIFRLKQ